MTYKILETRQEEETVYTKVEYTFDDETTLEVDIPHFAPEDKASVIAGIENRGVSESPVRKQEITDIKTIRCGKANLVYEEIQADIAFAYPIEVEPEVKK